MFHQHLLALDNSMNEKEWPKIFTTLVSFWVFSPTKNLCLSTFFLFLQCNLLAEKLQEELQESVQELARVIYFCTFLN